MMKKILTLSIVLLNSFNISAQCITPEPYEGNTGVNMTIMFSPDFITSLPEVSYEPYEAYIVALSNSGEVIGSVYFSNPGGAIPDLISGQGMVAVWGDDTQTPELDGAQQNESVSFQLVDGSDLYDVIMPSQVNFSANAMSFQTTAGTSTLVDCSVVEIFGCTDSESCVYNPEANNDDGSCSYPTTYYNCDGNCISDVDSDGICDELEIYGCKDATASNYNPSVTIDDGSCFVLTFEDWDFQPPVTDNNMSVAFPAGTLDDYVGGLLQAYVNGNPVSSAEWPIPEDGSAGVAVIGTDALCGCDLAESGDLLEFYILYEETIIKVEYDIPLTYNANWFSMNWYNSIWFTIDGSPIQLGCTDPGYLEYSPINNLDNGSCLAISINGCTDSESCVYNPEANNDDGSCTYPTTYYNCDGNCIFDVDSDGVCDELEIYGCMDATASNYNPSATEEDESCVPIDCEGLTVVSISLNDSYGDGWNGGFLTIDGIDYTVESGDDVAFGLCVDLSICNEILYTAGSWSFENSWTVSDASGVIVEGGHYSGVFGDCGIPDNSIDIEDFNFTPPVTDNNMSVVFPAGTLDDYVGGLLQAYVNGNPVSSAEWPIPEDGSAGVAVIGTDALCGCDLAESGDLLEFYILYEETIIKIEYDVPLYYGPNSFYWNWYNSIWFTVDGSPIQLGCTEPGYLEYSPNNNLDDGSCSTMRIKGCTNPESCIYNPEANNEDGSCTYPGCIDNTYIEYYNQGYVAGCDDGSCSIEVEDLELTVENFQEPMVTGSSMTVGFNISNIYGIEAGTVAAFYDLNGDGVINTEPFMATNGEYYWECVGQTEYIPNEFFTMGLWGDDSTTDEIEGLQTGQSDVIFAILTQDNQVIAFILLPEFTSYTTNGITVTNDINLDVTVYGCLDSNYCNYNPNAEEDDGTCEGIPGCMDELYMEYDSTSGCSNLEMCLVTWEQAFLITEDSIGSLNSDINVLDSLIDNLYNQLDECSEDLYYWSSPIDINLLIGWNMIGYTFPEPQDVVASVVEIDDIIQIIKNNNADVYWPEYGFNGIGDFIPGQGYQIKVFEAYSGFTYPDVGGQRIELVPTVPQWAIDMETQIHPNDIRTLVRVVNMLGQEVNPENQPSGTTLLYLYNDGTVEKKIINSQF